MTRDLLSLLSKWLSDNDETIQREAVRALGALCDGESEFVSAILKEILDFGALRGLSVLVGVDDVVIKCEAIKIVAAMFKEKACHEIVLAEDGLHRMLSLALSKDFVVKAEAVNSLGNLFANPACHPLLVNCGGLGVALSMATADEALLAQKGIRMLDALGGSSLAHAPLVRNGAIRRFKDLIMDCSDGLKASIAAVFISITSDPNALATMCENDGEFIATLHAIAEDDNHTLSSECLKVLLNISEMFAHNGQSADAVAAVADLSDRDTCRSQIIDLEGFARLSNLIKSNDIVVRREATRALSNLMENADDS